MRKNKKAIYELLTRNTYDGLVVDVKDDFGFLRYNSHLEFARKIGAVKPLFDLDELVAEARKNHKYLVVRLVVFKDAVLYDQPGFAVVDQAGLPWQGLPGEKWVNPYNPELAARYYVPLVKELTEKGVDEIQLDYIRFPTDGGVARISYSHRFATDPYRVEVLENFLYQIRMATHLPLSIDIYGYAALYRAPGLVGQDMQAIGRYVDVVCPMLYSSHFGDRYLTGMPIEQRAENLLFHSLSRARHLSEDRFLIRPYLQAFPMKNELWGYGSGYFLQQIRGAQAGGGSGYSFWGSMQQMLEVEATIENSQAP